ncbi:hypothetical protein [Mycolicibacter kumamotonensis]|uniref:Uncharacterized protein n=1 Tax=Mycolicibacter kumamotonensis TaxID=354243 RepID=A0A1B8SIG9_9MYCO|nr:hypothetical protein [Mycolicibacter kumamotonensis]OBY32540.1 hypothetical protein ACT18_07085 [Mycolicibacter kumamotonensis]
MTRSTLLVAVLVAGISVVAPNPVACADDNVTYEVVSDSVTSANLEYFDGMTRRSLEDVPLPWRTEAAISNPRSWATDGAEIRADWRKSIATPVWRPGKWVTVRIYIGNQLRCQNTLDVGNAACYGSTSFKS